MLLLIGYINLLHSRIDFTSFKDKQSNNKGKITIKINKIKGIFLSYFFSSCKVFNSLELRLRL